MQMDVPLNCSARSIDSMIKLYGFAWGQDRHSVAGFFEPAQDRHACVCREEIRSDRRHIVDAGIAPELIDRRCKGQRTSALQRFPPQLS
jgi:hypothetical protein